MSLLSRTWVNFFAVKLQTNVRICSKNFGHLKDFSATFLNERFHQFSKSNVDNFCISQKHETCFTNKTLITPKPCKTRNAYTKMIFFKLLFSEDAIIDSSDGRVVESVCFLSCRLGFDSESGQTSDFKIDIHSLPARRSASDKFTSCTVGKGT